MFSLRLSWKTPAAVLGMGAVGFALGTWSGHPSDASAQTPQGPTQAAATVQPKSDYSERVVAYIYNGEQVTREELGEFLIARHGLNYVEPLVNRRIIDHACKEKNIVVTDEEVEASLNEDLKPLNMDRATFVKQYLKQFNKTLYEWKEDVIRPRLMLTKLCGATIHVDEAEVRKAFDSEFGERVSCRIIMWRENDLRSAQQAWDKIRKSEAEFATAAKNQFMPQLGSLGGRIDPICHGVAENDMVEKIAFRLQKDEVSEIFTIPNQGYAVLKCDGRIPPMQNVSYEKEHNRLYRQAFDLKVTKEIPEVFGKLRKEANPQIIMPHGTTNPSVVRTQEEQRKAEKAEPQQIAPLPETNKK
jgi:hypothetical protein